MSAKAGAEGGESILDLPVVPELGALERPDAVIVTDFNAPQAVYDGLTEILPPARVLTPHLLHVERSPESSG